MNGLLDLVTGSRTTSTTITSGCRHRPENTVSEKRRQTISIISCADCGQIYKVSAPRLVDPEEVEVYDQPVGQAFAGIQCPLHFGALRWNTRFVDVPEETRTASTYDDAMSEALAAAARLDGALGQFQNALDRLRVANNSGDGNPFLRPGLRVRLEMEGVVVSVGEAGEAKLRLDDGSTWGPFLPRAAKFFDVSRSTTKSREPT